ncbi:MAG: HD domain-containing protein [Patescibacteria group bacterium]
MQSQIQKLIKNSKDPKFIEEVFEFARKTYIGKKWLSGHDDYIDHTVRMALILQEMGIDETTIAASLLYGVADTSLFKKEDFVIEEIEKKFGKEVTYLVKKASELNKIYYSFTISKENQKTFTEEKNESLRKMFFAIAKDLRVILLKIASRVDGLERIKFISPEIREIYATETLQIFVPIANRLGLGEVKSKLEDLAFTNIYPEKFKWLEENIKEKYEKRKKYLERFIPKFKKILKHERIKFVDVSFRAKSYWSTYQKLQKYNMDIEKVHDLVALRVIVKDIESCYKTLGIIHKYYKPISEEIEDYIAKPKLNGYKSLHTIVFLEEGKVSEVQIRTEQMQKEAAYGICAHWIYKEKIKLGKNNEERYSWTKEIPEFWKTFKIDFFENQIFTFTPKGDVIVLPKGSTPVDFAYAIHSDIGNHCEAAKIDGKIITLSKPLNNGDIVEIITSKKKQPSVDWLKFVKTGFARSHIKKILFITFSPIFSVPTFITKKIFRIGEKPKKETQIKKPKVAELYLGGQKGIAINFAKCCSPKPGDISKAFIGKYGPAVLHKTSCKNFQEIAQKFPEKIIDASWHQS